MIITVWHNNGLEGWCPWEYDSAESVLEAIKAGIPVPFRITQEVSLLIDARLPRMIGGGKD